MRIKKVNTIQQDLYHNDNYVGFIGLVDKGKYLSLEYQIDEKYRGKGIMRKQLPLFLKKYKNLLIMATVEDNIEFAIASKSLLLNNGFVFIKKLPTKTNGTASLYSNRNFLTFNKKQ